MNNQIYQSKIELFVIVMLLLTSLACGASTSEQVSEIVAEDTENSQVEADPRKSGTNEESRADTEEPITDENTEPEEAISEPEPEPTSESEAIPTPQPEALTIVESGFGQNGRSVGYGFKISNPNPNFAFEQVQYQVAALDESGAIVDTDSGFITLVLPGETQGVASSLFVDDGINVDSLDIQINVGEGELSEILPTFSISQARLNLGEFSQEALALIESPYIVPIEDARISALVYNDAGDIVGSGFTFANFIPAEGISGLEINLTTNDQASSVEVFATLSSLSLFSINDESIPAETQIILEQSGFGQSENSASFAFIITNPNPDQAIELSKYRATFYDADGLVVGVEDGFITLLRPSETLGVASSAFIVNELSISSVDLQLLTGSLIDSEPIPGFASENITFNDGDFSDTVTGFISSEYAQDITDINAFAIAFDETGSIIGGGSTFVDFVSADSNTAVEVSVHVSSVPTSVELYGAVSSLSELEE